MLLVASHSSVTISVIRSPADYRLGNDSGEFEFEEAPLAHNGANNVLNLHDGGVDLRGAKRIRIGWNNVSFVVDVASHFKSCPR